MASSSNRSDWDEVVDILFVDQYDWTDMHERFDVIDRALSMAVDATKNDWAGREASSVALGDLIARADESPEVRGIRVAMLVRVIAAAYYGDVDYWLSRA